MEAEGDGWNPVKITKDNHSPAKEQTAPSRVYCSQNSGHLAYVKIFQEAVDLSSINFANLMRNLLDCGEIIFTKFAIDGQAVVAKSLRLILSY